VYTSRRSIGVAVSVEAVRGDAPPVAVLTGYLAVAILGRDGRPTAVPPFAPHTPEQAALHREGEMRRQFHRELSRDRSVLTRPELLLVGATGDRRDNGVYYLLRELGGRLATRRRRTGAGVRAAESSYVHRIEPVRGGRRDQPVPAGTLLRWMETCAAMSASAFVEAPVRLIGVHGVAFQRPVPPEVFLHLYAIAVHSDDNGLTVHVTARAEDPLTGQSHDTVRGFVTYAPVDAGVAVPAVARTGAEEAALFCEVSLRKALRDRVAALHRPGRRPTNPG
jgi:acyl-CoA hydrolase